MEAVGGLLEAVPSDEPHRVERAAVAVGAQPIDGDDPRVLQAAGDLGLEQEPRPARRFVGVVVEDLLERHLAVKLGVDGDEDGAQAAPGVGPQDAEPLAVGSGRAHGVAGGAVGIAVAIGRGGIESRQGGVDDGVTDPRQVLAGGAAGGDRRQAPLGVAAMRLQVQRDHRLDDGAAVGVQLAVDDQVVGQGPGPVAGPGLEGGEKGALVDQPVPKRERSENEMAVCGGSHGAGAISLFPWLSARTWPPPPPAVS